MCWRSYTDEAAFIFAETNGEPHNTITPIARIRDGYFELDLVLRNNITTEEHPLGVYHPHAKLHHIKKENIGLIEVMGLAVLPSRLKSEMEQLADAILEGKDIRSNEVLEKHADWVEEFLPKYTDITKENIMDILHEEIGQVFNQVLEDAGVYKPNRQKKAGQHLNGLLEACNIEQKRIYKDKKRTKTLASGRTSIVRGNYLSFSPDLLYISTNVPTR